MGVILDAPISDFACGGGSACNFGNLALDLAGLVSDFACDGGVSDGPSARKTANEHAPAQHFSARTAIGESDDPREGKSR